MFKKKSLFLTAVLPALIAAGCSGGSKAETAYTKEAKSGDYVSAQIVSFSPVVGIYNDDGSVQINKEYTDLVTECYTAEGDLLYAVIKVDDYLKNLDPNLDLSNSITLSVMGNIDTVYCYPARTVHGKIEKSASIVEGLEETAGETALVVSGIDAQGSPDKANAQPFSDSLTGGDYAYIDIVGIVPAYSLSNNSMGGYSGYICYAEDAAGTQYWLYVSLENYRKYIDENVKADPYTIDGNLDQKNFDNPVRIYGGVTFSDSYSAGLSDEIGVKILHFDTME